MERLRDELASGEPLDAAEREALERTLREVADHLEAEEDEEPHGLVEALREAAVRFEESHPKLTMAIKSVADSLAPLGR